MRPFHGRALATGLVRPELDHPATLERGQAVVPHLGLDRVDRFEHGGPGPLRVRCLAEMERHARPLVLDEQPGRVTELTGHRAAERGGTRHVRGEAVVGRNFQPLGGDAARQRPGFDAVVAVVRDASHAHAPGDIARGAPGQDDDAQPIGLRLGEACEPAKGRTGCRNDPRGGRLEDDRRERAVEVGHDQQRPATGDEAADRGLDRRVQAAGRAAARHDVATRVVPTSTRASPPTGASDGLDAGPDGGGEVLGKGVGVGVGVGAALGTNVGTGVGLGAGSGAKARIPPRITAAVATPASRPMTIATRGHMRAERTSTTVARRHGRATATMPARWSRAAIECRTGSSRPS